jgi:hypothetical protein
MHIVWPLSVDNDKIILEASTAFLEMGSAFLMPKKEVD